MLKSLMIIALIFIFFSSCKKDPPENCHLQNNPYACKEGMYIGNYSPFSGAPDYLDTLYLEILSTDSFIIKSLDPEPIKLKIKSSDIYYLECNWTHCGRMINLASTDTLKYTYGYSWGGCVGGSNFESFTGIKH